MDTPTPAQIRQFYPQASSDDAVVQAYIDDAAIVAERCAGVVSAASTVQKSVVRWVAIHLMAVGGKDGGQVQSESIGDASKSYTTSGTSGVNLSSTVYGQRALLLDPSGCLVRLGLKRATFTLVS